MRSIMRSCSSSSTASCSQVLACRSLVTLAFTPKLEVDKTTSTFACSTATWDFCAHDIVAPGCCSWESPGHLWNGRWALPRHYSLLYPKLRTYSSCISPSACPMPRLGDLLHHEIIPSKVTILTIVPAFPLLYFSISRLFPSLLA